MSLDPQDSIPTEDRGIRLGQWFRDLREPLRRFIAVRRIGGGADLDDVAQEVFLRLLRYDKESMVSDPRAYLFKMASNVASEWSMRAGSRLPHDSTWLDDLRDDSDIAGEAEVADRNAQLRHAMQKLPPRAREILRLRFGEDLTHDMIAGRLGISKRIVKRDMAGALTALRFSIAGAERSGPELSAPRAWKAVE